jgi:hypothetical protein
MATTAVQTVQPFEAELTVEFEPWARHFPVDWIEQLAASLSTIQQTIWERKPRVVASGMRKASVSLDTYARDVTDAGEHATLMLRLHLRQVGLMDNSYSVSAVCSKR